MIVLLSLYVIFVEKIPVYLASLVALCVNLFDLFDLAHFLLDYLPNLYGKFVHSLCHLAVFRLG